MASSLSRDLSAKMFCVSSSVAERLLLGPGYKKGHTQYKKSTSERFIGIHPEIVPWLRFDGVTLAFRTMWEAPGVCILILFILVRNISRGWIVALSGSCQKSPYNKKKLQLTVFCTKMQYFTFHVIYLPSNPKPKWYMTCDLLRNFHWISNRHFPSIQLFVQDGIIC